jgi:ribosomal protein S12 methylthiotransferase accessory factor YcaO
VVQRDAIMTHWLTKTPPRQISAHSLPEHLRVMISDSERIGITVSVFDITALGIPTVCVLSVTRQAQKPQVVLSAASALTMVEAITSSLEELVNIAGIFNEAERESDADVMARAHEQPFVSKLSARTRQLYWRGEERLKDLDWFFAGGVVSLPEASGQDLPVSDDDTENLNTCLTVLKAQGEGYQPIVYYPINKIQKELGFYVAQVFIPKAFPLYLIEYYGTFKSERLHDFAKAMGLQSWELNPQPHMFS